MGLGPCRLVRSSSNLCPTLMGLVLTLGSTYKHAPDWKPKTSQHWIQPFNFLWVVRSQGCFDAKLIFFIPLPHKAQTKVLRCFELNKGKKKTSLKLNLALIYGRIFHAHYEHPLLMPIDPIKYWMEFPNKAYFNILISFSLWIPNCVKKM